MNYVRTIFLGFLGGFIALVLFVSLPGSGNFIFNLIKSNLIDFLGTEPTPAPTPVVTSPDFWQKIVSNQALSTVAIQSFRSNKLIREGSGIIISSDGIIITTFDVISGADVLQVFRGDKILRAKVVRYDGFKNVALLKVESENVDVARFDTNYQFQPGQDVIISGKLVEVSNPLVFAQEGLIGRVLSKDIVLDTELNYFLSGSKVINNSDIVVGMAYLRSGTVRLITAKTIDDFVKNYFQASE